MKCMQGWGLLCIYNARYKIGWRTSQIVGCAAWDTSASEIMMKPECQRGFWLQTWLRMIERCVVWMSGSGATSVAGLSLKGGPCHIGHIPHRPVSQNKPLPHLKTGGGRQHLCHFSVQIVKLFYVCHVRRIRVTML